MTGQKDRYTTTEKLWKLDDETLTTPGSLSQNSTKNPQVLSQNGTKNGGKWYHFSTIFDAVGAVSHSTISTKTGNRGAGRARMGVGGTEKRSPLSLSLSLIVLSRTIQYVIVNSRRVDRGRS
jgi:hypothetical protein